MAQPVTLASLAAAIAALSANIAEMQRKQDTAKDATLATIETLQMALEAHLVRNEAKAPADKPRAARKPAAETTATVDAEGTEEKKENHTKPVKAAAVKIDVAKFFIAAYMSGDTAIKAMVTEPTYKAAEEKTAVPKRGKQTPDDRKVAVLKTVYKQFSASVKDDLKARASAQQVLLAKDNSTELVREKTEVVEDDAGDNADNEGH